MGLISKASHVHWCPQCQAAWTHGGYSCAQYTEAACATCAPAPKQEEPTPS